MTNPTGRRRIPAIAAGLATLAMTLSLAAPAQARTFQDYVALGDSYAAGIGGGEYLIEDCLRSANAYPELADDLKTVRDVTNVACGGATTQLVVETQLGQLDKTTDLVTITAGGNNLGFGAIVTSCGALAFGDTSAAAACEAALAYAEFQLNGPLEDDLVEMIRAVQAAAPKAEIVVTGYPYLFDPIPPGATDPLSRFIYQATDLADRLNATISDAAEATGVEYVDVADQFAGHGINSITLDPWIILGSSFTEENFHPNEEGYEAYFAALQSEGVYN